MKTLFPGNIKDTSMCRHSPASVRTLDVRAVPAVPQNFHKYLNSITFMTLREAASMPYE